LNDKQQNVNPQLYDLPGFDAFDEASPRHEATFTKGYYYYLLKAAKEGILITNSLCVLVVN